MSNSIDVAHKTTSLSGFDMEYADTEKIGSVFREIFGEFTLREIRRQLTENIRGILQNAIQSTPVDNPMPAAKGALLFSLILEATMNLNQDIRIADFEDITIGADLKDILWMFTDTEIMSWATDATDYFLSLDDRGLIYVQLAQIISMLCNVKLMTQVVVRHGKKAMQPIAN